VLLNGTLLFYLCSSVFICGFLSSSAHAQLPIHSDAAVQPSAGHFLLRQQLEFMKLGRDPTGFGHQVREYIATTNITYGLTQNFALTANIPLIWQSVDSEVTDHSGHGGGGGFPGFPFPFPPPPTTDVAHPLGSDFGLDDITIGFKWRIYEHDFGPIDTLRIALLGATETPTGEDAYSSDSWDPEIGAVISYIQGRHGANASLLWKFNTGKHPLNLHAGMGEDDALFYNASYLFRLLPSQYTTHSKDATYLLLEANGIYETNGDNEILLAPGIMYETKNIALEFSIGFPIFQSIENRPKTDLTLTLGLRLFI
jgi:outer membrane putative beta-barrel porin/alpha-amylase